MLGKVGGRVVLEALHAHSCGLNVTCNMYVKYCNLLEHVASSNIK